MMFSAKMTSPLSKSTRPGPMDFTLVAVRTSTPRALSWRSALAESFG
jgi:hypothetical protein